MGGAAGGRCYQGCAGFAGDHGDLMSSAWSCLLVLILKGVGAYGEVPWCQTCGYADGLLERDDALVQVRWWHALTMYPVAWFSMY